MARKSRKADFVNAGKTAADAASVKAGHETEAKRPVFRAGLYARLSFESGANRERSTVETQMELLRKFVDQTTDIVVEKEYFDISKTGTDFERSGFRYAFCQIPLPCQPTPQPLSLSAGLCSGVP